MPPKTIDTRNEAKKIKSASFTREVFEKSQIVLSQYWKKITKFDDALKIILHFGCTNNQYYFRQHSLFSTGGTEREAERKGRYKEREIESSVLALIY